MSLARHWKEKQARDAAKAYARQQTGTQDVLVETAMPSRDGWSVVLYAGKQCLLLSVDRELRVTR